MNVNKDIIKMEMFVFYVIINVMNVMEVKIINVYLANQLIAF